MYLFRAFYHRVLVYLSKII